MKNLLARVSFCLLLLLLSRQAVGSLLQALPPFMHVDRHQLISTPLSGPNSMNYNIPYSNLFTISDPLQAKAAVIYPLCRLRLQGWTCGRQAGQDPMGCTAQ